jgi:transcriptional regulator with XRE-family HTH domain
MTLEKFLADSGMSKGEFAERVKISPGRLSQLLHDPDQLPSRDLIHRIDEATGGKVTFKDWVSPPARRRSASNAA